MTTTTKGRGKRATMPTPEVTVSSSPGLDALTGAGAGWAMLPLELLDPHPANPRRELGDLTELVESIRAHGVRQNLLVVPHPGTSGRYRVVIGHRRAAGAREAGLEHVPAVVDVDLDETGQRELMLLENVQRSDLTPVEEADGYQGLLDLGLDEKEIAKRTGRSRSTVAARLRLRSLPEPAREKVHTHQATLDDAERLLAVAELAPDVAAELTERSFGTPDFAHAAQRAIDNARREAERQAVVDGLVAAGVRVVEADPEAYWNPPRGVKKLSDLTAEAPKAGRAITDALDVETHRSCPGHVAWLSAYRPEAEYGCDDWKAQGHHDRWATPKSAGEPDTDRKAVVETNRAALAAEAVRREWLTEFLTRKKLPADALVYAADILTTAYSDWFRDRDIAHQLLGITADDAKTWSTTSPARATAYMVALAAGRVEAQMPKGFWRASSTAHRLHLRWLQSWGYQLSDVEQSVLDAATKKGA